MSCVLNYGNSNSFLLFFNHIYRGAGKQHALSVSDSNRVDGPRFAHSSAHPRPDGSARSAGPIARHKARRFLPSPLMPLVRILHQYVFNELTGTMPVPLQTRQIVVLPSLSRLPVPLHLLHMIAGSVAITPPTPYRQGKQGFGHPCLVYHRRDRNHISRKHLRSVGFEP